MSITPFPHSTFDRGTLKELTSAAHLFEMIGRFIDLNPGSDDDELKAYLFAEVSRRRAREPENRKDRKAACDLLDRLSREGRLTTKRDG
ncbi:hypothetical protein [Brucella pituitosa]|uniref:hypothetical protein n=1 Tax=Brucella pituitosa TaxID=571256 RepID=UPI0009A24D2F|nr:hypothetical protein [Brucella pituitosa]